jgi:hypothetical protein
MRAGIVAFLAVAFWQDYEMALLVTPACVVLFALITAEGKK